MILDQGDHMDIDKVFTVLEINSVVSELIQTAFPQTVWVCGEIQGLRPDRDKRHTYFELVQKDSHCDRIVAKAKVALFAGRKPLIYRRISETKGAFSLKNDIEVKFLCQVSLHPPTGQYSLIVVDIDTVYTLGKFAQNRLKIIEDLRKRGLLDKNKLLDFSLAPLKVGLITAQDSAAYHDFINELTISKYAFSVFTYNCHMQGKMTEKDVIKALKYFNSLSDKDLDVIVVTRGGGSTSDLTYFDSKKIAETIAGSKFPVVSALGHQIDNTVTDLCAHTVCKTPTKAAAVLVERVRGFLETLQNKALRMDNLAGSYFQVQKDDILDKRHRIFNQVKLLASSSKQHLDTCFNDLKAAAANILKTRRQDLNYRQKNIEALDPKNTLRRGYSITRKAKTSLKSISQVKKGDLLETLLYDGSFISAVKDVSKKQQNV